MTTTKPPVLTDEELIALWDRHVGTPCDKYPLGPRDAINFGRAVLERAGADAVRDAALEEAVRELEKRRALLRGQYESVNITEADAMYGLCIDAIRALKDTPAAAVAQPTRIGDDDRMTLAGTLGLLRGHRYTGSADALQRVLDADAALATAVVAHDEAKALDLLATLFDAYENGPTCYEDPDDCAGYLGNAVRLNNDDFRACAELLNRRRPRQAGQLSGNAGQVADAQPGSEL